jgi:hypothetical protein
MGCFLSKALLASFWGGGGGVQTIFKKCIFFFKVNSVTSQYSPLAHKSSWNDWPRNLDDYSKLMNELNVSFSFMSHSLTSKIVLFCFYLSLKIVWTPPPPPQKEAKNVLDKQQPIIPLSIVSQVEAGLCD